MASLLVNSDGSIGFNEPPTCNTEPTESNQLATKNYVDTHGNTMETIILSGDTPIIDGTVSLSLENGTQAYCLNMLDINSYEALKDGIIGSVSALKFDSVNNLLYVGGSFTIVDQPSIQGLAVWNLTTRTWSSLNAVFLNSAPSVNTIELLNGVLYIGGKFTISTTSGSVQNSAKYNISSEQWTTFGTFLAGVNKIINFNGFIYVGGEFSTFLTSYRLADAVWVSVGASGTVTDMTIDPITTTLYVVGSFTAINTSNSSVSATAIAQLSSSGTWSNVGGNTSINPSARVAAYNSKVAFIVSSTYGRAVQLYDNGSWTIIGYASSINSALYLSNGLLYISGQFTSIVNSDFTNNVTACRVSYWDGTQWYPAGEGVGKYFGNSSLNANVMTADSDNNLFIGGTFLQSNGTDNLTNNIVHLVMSDTHSDLYSVAIELNETVVCKSLLKNKALILGVTSSGTPYATPVVV